MVQTKVIVFDFDDTLVKSERGKQEAPIEIFSVIPGAREIAAEYRAGHRNTPRRELIAGILAALEDRGIPVTIENPVEHFLNKFGQLTEETQTTAPIVSGAEKALESRLIFHHLYLNTATPQEFIDRVISARGWKKFFKGIYGSPPGTKIDHLQEIIAQESVKPQEVVVVGDGRGDLESAESCGCRFIGVRGEYYDFGNPPFPILDDLRNLEITINSFKTK